MRFGRVPKKEKARIIEQMHMRTGSHVQSASLSSMLLSPNDLIKQVITAHQQVKYYSEASPIRTPLNWIIHL